ncbi:hypothetical protein L596_018495 [Steinernema carpocapsae]|uniref:Tudor domain-containing protein n=1 Tax=Steinernema carpocapsae TaxID=34508 RepID=A0A4U5N5I5_STECR|nr:hypothetical protein L596_018495 [Steinernema carpocapsae]
MAGKVFFSGEGFTCFRGLPHLPVPKQFKGRITHATSFSYVFVRTEESEKVLEAIEGNLEEYLKSKPPAVTQVLRNGLAVISYGPESRVSRVLILENKGTMANVVFVDFGNIEEVPSHLLHALPEEISKIPAQVIPLKVENAPANSEQRILFDDFVSGVVGSLVEVELLGGTMKHRLKATLEVEDGSGTLHNLEEIVSWRNTSFWKSTGRMGVRSADQPWKAVDTGLQKSGLDMLQPSSLDPNGKQSGVAPGVFVHLVYLLMIASAVGVIFVLWRRIRRTKKVIRRSLQMMEYENTVQNEESSI